MVVLRKLPLAPTSPHPNRSNKKFRKLPLAPQRREPKRKLPAPPATRPPQPRHKGKPPPAPKASAAAREIYPGERVPYSAIPHVHGAGWLTGGRWVTMQAWNVNLRVTGSLGPEGMVITGGLGDWQEVRIPRGDPYSQWNGRTLYTATLTVLFDGWGRQTRSVEPELKALDQLATRMSGTVSPPPLRIWGAIPKWGLPWVITSLEYGDVIRDRKSGHRVRQACTVHLLEYRSEEHAATTRRAAAKPKPVQKYKVKHGDTLKSIAAKFLGNSNKWEVIAKANKGLRGWQIPRSFIGKTIKVPSK